MNARLDRGAVGRVFGAFSRKVPDRRARGQMRNSYDFVDMNLIANIDV
jgi:hypothetical protein